MHDFNFTYLSAEWSSWMHYKPNV